MMAVVMTNLENKKNKKPEAPKPAPTPKVEAAADKAVPATPVTPAKGLKSEQIFGMMATYLNQGLGKPLIPKVASTFGFEICATKGAKPALIYSINLKDG